MVLFPNAKINIGLNIVSKRHDGYHNLETLFYPVQWRDVLEVIPSQQFKFSYSGIEINSSQNICEQAFYLMKNEFNLSNVHIHLHKNIPIGAGLGGGSSDAAFTLMALNEMFDLNLTKIKLKEYALNLGADCPFFIDNRPSIATGVGEILSPVELDLSGYHLLIVKPSVFVSTSDAFSNIVPQQSEISIIEEIKKPISQWNLSNDFEYGIFDKYPEISNIKKQLDEAGALFSSMSGSGSSVFAFFDYKPNLQLNEHTWHYQLI